MRRFPGLSSFDELRKSFGVKIVSAFIAVIAAVLSTFTVLLVHHQSREVRDALIKEGRMLASLLAHNARTGVFAENVEVLRDLAQGMMNQRDVVSVSISTAEGRHLFTAAKSLTSVEPQAARVEGGPDSGIHASPVHEFAETASGLVFVRPVMLEVFDHAIESLYFSEANQAKTERVIGYVTIVMDKRTMNKAMESILVQHSTIAVLFIISGSLIILITVRKVTRPLGKLTEQVRLLGKGEAVRQVPIESDDEIGRLAGAFNTMSEDLRKREEEKALLEKQLAQSRKLEAVGTLAKGIAHDFNNLLTTVKGSVYLLQKRLDRSSPLLEYTGKMQDSLHKAQDLIQSLLIFSKGQAVQPKPLELNTLVAQMQTTLVSLAGEQVECSFSLCPGAIVVMADRVQIEQVLMNLVTNARDAMPEGGAVSVRTDAVEVRAERGYNHVQLKPGYYAVICVADGGAGIDEQVRDRIFEPFFTTKEVGKGVGLGLSIVYGIVEHYKGTIEVKTGEGRGTAFTIYLPLAETNRKSGRAGEEAE
ncbi:MAG: ATP-binding protein [Nitrospirota bacterium]